MKLYIKYGCATLLIVLMLFVLQHNLDNMGLPYEEGKNADNAYKWYIETHPEVKEQYNIDSYPTCSLMAREWVDAYRNNYNLTSDEYTCAIWYNDMTDWFYY